MALTPDEHAGVLAHAIAVTQQATMNPIDPTVAGAYLAQAPAPQFKVEKIEQVEAPVMAWRSFVLNGRCLQGQFGVDWESREMRASCGRVLECPESPILAREHLQKGACNCGIHGARDAVEVWTGRQCSKGGNFPDNYPTPYQQIAVKAALFGTVVEHERGFRAEYGRMETIYVLQPRPCLKHPYWKVVEKPQFGGAITDHLPTSFFSEEDLKTVISLAHPPMQYMLECSEEYTENPLQPVADMLQEQYGVPVHIIGVLDFLAGVDRGDF